MKYRIVKIDRAFHIVRDLNDDPPYSEVDTSQPIFMTLEGAEKFRQTLEDEWISSLDPTKHPHGAAIAYEKAKTQRPDVA